MKTIKRLTSLVLTATVITSFSAVGISANAAENDKVRVIVSNDVFSKADGAAWEGTLVDEWVDIDENSTMLSSVVKALENHGYTQTGADSGYFSEINGLSSSDCQMGGWNRNLPSSIVGGSKFWKLVSKPNVYKPEFCTSKSK